MKNLFRFSALLILLTGSLYVKIANAQNKELFIEYECENQGMNWPLKVELRSGKNVNLSTNISTITMGGSIKIDRETGNITKEESVPEEIESREYIFKDLENNQMFSKETFAADFYIKEQMNLFQWELTNEKETILEYTCQKAKAQFRGREYIAWFTTELPFKAAPWKLHALPGVVLKAETTDQFYKIEAKKMIIQTSEEAIKNPYQGKKIITWSKYVEKYKSADKKLMERMKALRAKSNIPESEIPNHSPKLEIILEKNREGFSSRSARFKSYNLQ